MSNYELSDGSANTEYSNTELSEETYFEVVSVTIEYDEPFKLIGMVLILMLVDWDCCT